MEWLGLAELIYGLPGMAEVDFGSRSSWIRHDSFLKKLRRKKEEEKIKI
jgi:hypothetical protein